MSVVDRVLLDDAARLVADEERGQVDRHAHGRRDTRLQDAVSNHDIRTLS